MTRCCRQPCCKAKRSSYVRQSALQQVQSDLESQQDQYELVDVARRRGFANVEIIAACPQMGAIGTSVYDRGKGRSSRT